MRLYNIKAWLNRKLYPRFQIFALLLTIAFVAPVDGFQKIEPVDPPRDDKQTVTPEPQVTNEEVPRTKLRSPKFDGVVIKAFKSTHQGYSSDEVILNDELNDGFIKACQAELATTEIPDASVFDVNWLSLIHI